MTLVLLTFAAPNMFGQGCTQCLDSTRATPPQVQASYRHAIYLLGGAASTLFITGILLLGQRSLEAVHPEKRSSRSDPF